MVPSRRPRHWRWFVAFVVLDAIVFGFTWHSHLTYVGGPGKPTIMPVGQLIGWAFFVMITVGLLLAAYSSYRTRRLPSYHSVRIQPPSE